MTPESINNSGRNNNLPAPASLNNIDFEIKGQLDSTSIQMEQPLTGQSKYKLSTTYYHLPKKRACPFIRQVRVSMYKEKGKTYDDGVDKFSIVNKIFPNLKLAPWIQLNVVV